MFTRVSIFKGVLMKILRKLKPNSPLAFLTLILWSNSLLAWNAGNIALPDQGKFAFERDGEICVAYPDGGIGFVKGYKACGKEQCAVLFPPSKEKYDEALSGKCPLSSDNKYDNVNAPNYKRRCERPWWGGAPNMYLERYRFDKSGQYIRKIHDEYKRCPNFEEYQEIKNLFSLDKLALEEYMEKSKREDNERQAQFSKNMSLACKGRPELNMNYYEAMARKFETNPESIKFQRAVFDGSCNLTFYYPAGVISCNLSNTDAVNGKLQFNVSNSCSK
jgi:hypothetical protein